jgi:hypothetical protein
VEKYEEQGQGTRLGKATIVRHENRDTAGLTGEDKDRSEIKFGAYKKPAMKTRARGRTMRQSQVQTVSRVFPWFKGESHQGRTPLHVQGEYPAADPAVGEKTLYIALYYSITRYIYCTQNQ